MKLFSTLRRIFLSLAVLCMPVMVVQPVVAANANTSRFAQRATSSDTVEVKFADNAEVVLQNDEFVSTTNQVNLASTNQLLKAKKTKAKRQLANQGARNRHKQLLREGKTTTDVASYFRVQVGNGQNAADVAKELKQMPGVTDAYAAPLPVPAPAATPNFTALQKSLTDAPIGMGVNSAASLPAAKGKNVKIADLEYSWSTTHEDLAKNWQADAMWAVGTPIDPFNDNNHGTAVSGIIGATNNSVGVNGIVPDAEFHMVNTNSLENGWDPASAISLATSKLSAGDVILLEQQAVGPNGEFVPVEWIPSVYDAIKTATAAGIIVIEPAGNGGANLDDPIYGTSFPSGKANSGAIMVGAGSNGTYTCANYSSNHWRMSFSNYGKRVNLQANGECVVTTGYADYYGSLTTNNAYTKYFNGTSSASALMAANVAAFSSSYEEMFKKPASPILAVWVFTATGTAQDTTTTTGNIGPLPNLTAAIKALDTTAPSTPKGVTIRLNSHNRPLMQWQAATDNSGVTGYRIYRNGTLLTTVTGSTLKYTDVKTSSKTTYKYQIQAIDILGNASAKSSTVTITTK